jgi:hypothetical protein
MTNGGSNSVWTLDIKDSLGGATSVFGATAVETGSA